MDEVEQLVRAMYEMLGSYVQPAVSEQTIRDHVDRYFRVSPLALPRARH